MSNLILLCAATSIEARACRRGIAGSREPFEILHTGMGMARAEQALAHRLAQGDSPSWIISTGFAGSLDPTVRAGRWISGRSVEFGAEVFPVQGLPSGFPAFSTSAYRSVAKLTAKADPEALMLDMESAAWARIACQQGIPFGILRLVSDSPHEPLPAFIEDFSKVLTEASTGAQLRSIASGLGKVVSEPLLAIGFIARSSSLPHQLEQGWKKWTR